MSLNAEIRSAQLADGPDIWPLVQNFAVSYVPTRATFDKSFKDVLADQRAALLVADLDGHIVGYALAALHTALFADGQICWIEEVFVREDHRRSAVGTSLVSSIESWAQEAGARYVSLATRRAAPFYGALGYTESATFFKKSLD